MPQPCRHHRKLTAGALAASDGLDALQLRQARCAARIGADGTTAEGHGELRQAAATKGADEAPLRPAAGHFAAESFLNCEKTEIAFCDAWR